MKKLTLRDLQTMERPITCCTAFDYSSIQMAEEAEMDVLIPDDWAMGTTIFGERSALSVDLNAVLFYLSAVTRNAQRAYILAPMPFGSYQISNEEAVRNAARLIKGGADGVKLESGGATIDRIRALAEVGIACVGHLGYCPQLAKSMGDERVVGDTADEAQQIFEDARKLQEAGAWGVFLQNVPERVAKVITERTSLITIGAGGTRGCKGHFILAHDLLGWPREIKPLVSIPYGNFFERAVESLNKHCAEVHALQFPTEKQMFNITDDEYNQFIQELKN